MADEPGQTGTPSRRRKLKWENAFFDALRRFGVVRRACLNAAVSRTAVYEARKSREDFVARWEQAMQDASDRLEEEARRRALRGLVKKKFTAKGEPVIDPKTGEQYFEREYSDSLLTTLLKAHKPEFRDTTKHEHSGPRGGPIEVIETVRNGNVSGNGHPVP